MNPPFVRWVHNRHPAQPSEFELSEAFWAEAALLAAARLQSNEGRRHQRRDRQAENARVDLMGAGSEILLYRALQRYALRVKAWAVGNQLTPEQGRQQKDVAGQGLDYMRRHLFVLEGGASAAAADLILPCEDGDWAMDAKSFDFSPNKSRFAINEEKHLRLAPLNPDYFCLLCPPLSKRALVAVVPYSEVESWETRTLGKRHPPDPAKIIPIDRFTLSFLQRPFNVCADMTEGKHDPRSVRSRAGSDGEVKQRISETAPLISELLEQNATALDDALQAILRF